MRSLANPLSGDRRALVEVVLGRQITAITPAEGGGNNRVFRIDTAEGRYALKLYPAVGHDTRDRLGAETAAATFLRGIGVDTVPKFIACVPSQQLAVFEWIDGSLVSEPNDRDIDEALAFTAHLRFAARSAGAEDLMFASEACLSAEDLSSQIQRRHARLQEAARDHDDLALFLRVHVAPLTVTALERARSAYEPLGVDFSAEIPRAAQTLNPSDFGFHNAKRRADGRLVFFDLEYFGWDDPVKLVADFLLHPGMSLRAPQQRRFGVGACGTFNRDWYFLPRLRALFPLYALRWTMILLNEFLPERWARRVAAGVVLDRQVVLAQQLRKAEAMLQNVTERLNLLPS